jgi:RHS repeat-associated protein
VPYKVKYNNQIYYLSYNHQGTLNQVTDINAKTVKSIIYSTYGDIIEDTNPNLNIPFGFAGGLYDKDTKLIKFGYRDYDPNTGKWITKDPIRFDGGDINLYNYVVNDPVNGVDPEGLADSGLWHEIPGTDYRVRIDNPHNGQTNQQKHAHIEKNGKDFCVVNQDGSSSHDSDTDKIKNKKLIKYLRDKGFNIQEDTIKFRIPPIRGPLIIIPLPILERILNPPGEEA